MTGHHTKVNSLVFDQFEFIQESRFNGVKLLGNGFSPEKIEFLDSLNSWLKASEDLVKDQYDWDPVITDSCDLVVEENGPVGGSSAFVSASVVTSSGPDQHKWMFKR